MYLEFSFLSSYSVFTASLPQFKELPFSMAIYASMWRFFLRINFLKNK